MSLATRCTACNTVFRVTQGQLSVLDGWVRCGRCQQDFNALDKLFDLEIEDTAELTSEPVGIGPSLCDATAQLSDDALVVSEPSASDSMPGQESEGLGDEELFGAALEVPGEVDIRSDVRPQEQSSAVRDENVGPPPAFILGDRVHPPSDSSGTRIALSLLALLLTAALLLQCAFHFRNTLTALFPQTRATLIALCRLVECRIEPPSRIDDIVVDSSALTREPGGNAFRLVVVLRNRGTVALAMPAMELTLTDSYSQVLARRTLMPADFNRAADILMPAMETSVMLVLAGASMRTTGYTVEAFYP